MYPTRRIALATAVSIALFMPLAHAQSGNPTGAFQFLTGPQQGDTKALALSYFGGRSRALGLTPSDVGDMLLKDDYVTRHNGIRHLYWRQRIGGIEVWNADLAINVAADGSIINMHQAFVPDLSSKATVLQPEINAAAAISFAASAIGTNIRAPLMLLRQDGGPAQKAIYSGAGISADDIPVQLIYQPVEDGRSVRLAWDMVIRETDTANWWSLRIDAVTGELIGQVNYMAEHGSEKAAAGGTSYQYRVFLSLSRTPIKPGISWLAIPMIQQHRPSVGTIPTELPVGSSPIPAAITSTRRMISTATTPAAPGRAARVPTPWYSISLSMPGLIPRSAAI